MQKKKKWDSTRTSGDFQSCRCRAIDEKPPQPRSTGGLIAAFAAEHDRAMQLTTILWPFIICISCTVHPAHLPHLFLLLLRTYILSMSKNTDNVWWYYNLHDYNNNSSDIDESKDADRNEDKFGNNKEDEDRHENEEENDTEIEESSMKDDSRPYQGIEVSFVLYSASKCLHLSFSSQQRVPVGL